MRYDFKGQKKLNISNKTSCKIIKIILPRVVILVIRAGSKVGIEIPESGTKGASKKGILNGRVG